MDILSAAIRYNMFEPGDRVLVAVSGGPDSVALLHALHTRSDEFGIVLRVAHLNHGIRGEAADADAEFVRQFAEELGLPVTMEKADVPSERVRMHLGEEEAARHVRFEFLTRTIAKLHLNKLALGHNADDRAESVLLNIIRGAGIEGLGSIRPKRGPLVRPLIDTPRSEIEAYIREHDLPFRIDESNLDTAYTRNRVRHELIPMLEERYNPQVRAALGRLAEIAAMDSSFVHNLAESARVDVARKDGIDVSAFLRTPPALQYEMLRCEMLQHKGDLKDLSFQQVQRVVQALRSGGDFKITLSSGALYAVRRDNVFRIEHKTEPPLAPPFDTVLAVPGVTAIQEVNVRIKAELVENPSIHKTPPNQAVIASEKLVGRLRVRNPLPGDATRPFGMSGHKKLQDVFVDKKIPRDDRSRTVVVRDEEKIVWVAGVTLSEDVRVTESTRTAILLTAEPDR